MPVFYFDVADGQFHEDEEGHVLPDASHVEGELKRRLSEIILSGDGSLSAFVNVRDERRGLVATGTISAKIAYPDTHH